MRFLLTTIFFVFILALPVSAKEFVTPSGKIVSAEHPTWGYVKKIFTLPSGLKYAALQLIPIAQAETLTLEQEIKLLIKLFAERFGVSAKQMEDLADCESGFRRIPAEEAIKAHNTNEPRGGPSLGLYQWQVGSWNYYNRQNKTKLDRENWKDQIEMTARVLSEKEGWRNWVWCWKNKVL